MYQPKHFEQADRSALAALMHEQPLATLVSTPEGAVTADHIPLLYDADAGAQGTLRGHVARANPIWQRCAGGEVLAIFHGVQAYISPGWYPSKQQHGKVVPTWNYAVVHAHGSLRTIEDPAWLHALVSRLTVTHEGRRPMPWAVTDAPAEYVDQMLRAIVGIEIEVTRLEGKFKLSQNRAEDDRAGTARGLAAETAAPARDMAPLVFTPTRP